MDELLQSRVDQLKQIEDLLSRLEQAANAGKFITATEIRIIRHGVLDMITKAEREHAEF